jgi:hypothetical protein
MVLYTGVPAVALAFVGALVGQPRGHSFVFFLLLAVVPLLELVVIGWFGLWWPLWYHGFLAMAGLAVLGGYGWKALTERAPRWIVLTAGTGGAAASLALLAVYHTTAFGDRPRWKEAVAIVTADAASSSDARAILSHAPGVIAHYIGVPPGETMRSPAVKLWRGRDELGNAPAYVIVLEPELHAADRSWLHERCRQLIRLPSRMVIRDRTIVALRCQTETSN